MTTIVTINATDQITNSRSDINTNFANLNSDKIETSYLDTDTALAANSDTKIATQKAVKAYVDAAAPGLRFVGCRVYQNSGGATESGSTTAQAFQVESFDTDSMHSTSSNTSRITINTAGKYLFGGTVRMTTQTDVGVSIRLNNTTILAQSGYDAQTGENAGATATGVYDFAQNDYIEIIAATNGVGTTSGDTSTNFWAYKIG